VQRAVAEANAKAAEKAAKEREASIQKLEEQALCDTYTTHTYVGTHRSCAYTCACTSLLTAAGPGQAAEWRKLATDMLKEKKRDK